MEHFSWASFFIAMAPVAAAAAILVALGVPTSKERDAAAPEIAGLVLSSATMALLVFTIIEAPVYGWGAVRSLVGFAASAVLLAAFIVRERRGADPVLDVRMFRNLQLRAASAAVTVSFLTLFGFMFLMTQYFQLLRGYGPLSTAVHLLPVALSVGAGSVAGTQLAVRAGAQLIVTIGLVATAAFYGWVAVTTSATISFDIIAAQMTYLYDEARRVLRPGGRLAIWDITAGAPGALDFPLPWADQPVLSHLAPAARLRATIESAGLAVTHWRDMTEDAVATMEVFLRSPPGPLGLHVFVDNFVEKANNLVHGLAYGRLPP